MPYTVTSSIMSFVAFLRVFRNCRRHTKLMSAFHYDNHLIAAKFFSTGTIIQLGVSIENRDNNVIVAKFSDDKEKYKNTGTTAKFSISMKIVTIT